MLGYKIHTQRHRALSGAFDPQQVEAGLNAHAADGWRLAEGFMVSSLWKSTKGEIVLIVERPIRHRWPDDMSETPTGDAPQPRPPHKVWIAQVVEQPTQALFLAEPQKDAER